MARTLAWDTPSPDPGDIDHYVVYQGTVHGVYDGGTTVAYPTTTYSVTGLPGTFYVVTAVDTSDNESANSNEVMIPIPTLIMFV